MPTQANTAVETQVNTGSNNQGEDGTKVVENPDKQRLSQAVETQVNMGYPRW